MPILQLFTILQQCVIWFRDIQFCFDNILWLPTFW